LPLLEAMTCFLAPRPGQVSVWSRSLVFVLVVRVNGGGAA
jgi:hypothetical protein